MSAPPQLPAAAAPPPSSPGVDPLPSGFRLQRLEVFNWGTFHGRFWTFDLHGQNALLTGDIGSGKSTLIDALTTLLVPAHRVAYNKAAGAESKERTLRSYVLGYYKSERGEISGAKPVALRTEEGTYSVILAHFRDAVLGADVTVAQVFWCTDGGQPNRLYVVADRGLSISEHFTGFGIDITGLRKRLRKLDACEIHDAFAHYAAAFRRRVGLSSEQALELFHQTVSMKAVGNLTEFVRVHMLPRSAVEERIDALLGHFADLNRAHQAVVEAQSQVAQLEPLLAESQRHAEEVRRREDLVACREALPAYFAGQRLVLLDRRLVLLGEEDQRLGVRREQALQERSGRESTLQSLIGDIARNGGDRLSQIEIECDRLAGELTTIRERAAKVAHSCTALGLPLPVDGEAFVALATARAERIAIIEVQHAENHNALVDADVAIRQLREEHRILEEERRSLTMRRSNIEERLIRLRRLLCADLGDCAEEDLPFAGELIRVRSDELAWEGAIERVLHSFGLALLVPGTHYERVAAWVDRTDLRSRLVYYHVPAVRVHRLPATERGSLVRKLEHKPQAWCAEWLLQELSERFNYICCESLADFQRQPQALTLQGQVKGARGRHEKDDRSRIDDRTRYVLGWSNQEKIAAIAAQLAIREEQVHIQLSERERLDALQRGLREQQGHLQRLGDIGRFSDIDPAPVEQAMARLAQERARLRDASSVLEGLNDQKRLCQAELETLARRLDELNRGLGSVHERQAAAGALRLQALEAQSGLPGAERSRCFPLLDAIAGEQPSQRELTVESADNCQSDWRRHLQERIDATAKRIERLSGSIVNRMGEFRRDWPHLTQEVDPSLEAAPGYLEILVRLQGDDLPRFLADFKRALNENTINEIVNFQSQLEREQKDIRERIEEINRSLSGIDYNPSRYIALVASATADAEIGDFRRELRGCTMHILGSEQDEAYAEAKFQQVRHIIERFQGRSGLAEADQHWRVKVTDVRNWFTFSASERWRADHSEHEHYADSGGKSGGQKEKLAYTVLAASLSYQFGLSEAGSQRRFCFVTIDEAFGRGSDESARYGLELFTRLQLQLLIATPLQKIRVIEPYVSSVGFVSCREGRESSLLCLTIAEYHAQAQAAQAGAR